MKTTKTLLIITLLMIVLPAFDCRKKPQLFVIGDSISIFYGPYLKKYTAGKFIYDRKRDKGEAMQNLDNPVGANGGNSKMVLEYLTEFLKNDTIKPDIFLINCGLHDIKTNTETGKKATAKDEYRKNIDQITRLILKSGKKMIWINSTPVNDSIHNIKNVGFYRYNKDVIAYNLIADSICSKNNIPVIDLYSFSATFPLEAYQDHVHYSERFRELQAAFISGFLETKEVLLSLCR